MPKFFKFSKESPYIYLELLRHQNPGGSKMTKTTNNSLYWASISPLSKKEEMELAQKVAAGNKQARETLIRANIRYALSYAKKFYGHGLSSEEVDSEAVIGLIKAIDHFDSSHGTRIITLAKMYIMNEIVSARNKSGCVQRQSDARLRMILKINKTIKKINNDCNHEELMENISAKTGFDEKMIARLFEESRPCLSLDDSTDSEDGYSLLSSIPDTHYRTPEETTFFHIQKESLYKNLEKLDPKEKEIICMLYGLKNYKKNYSLSEIGEMFNESKQKIFYIKERALNKLKRSMENKAA